MEWCFVGTNPLSEPTTYSESPCERPLEPPLLHLRNPCGQSWPVALGGQARISDRDTNIPKRPKRQGRIDDAFGHGDSEGRSVFYNSSCAPRSGIKKTNAKESSATQLKNAKATLTAQEVRETFSGVKILK